jgi:peptide/nickel transport system permease protein
MILPAITLAILYSAFFAKITRGAMIAALNSDQVMFARASGLRERTVVRYALVEARTPIMTYTAILVAQVIGASTVIETVFAWRGVSHWGLQGILNVDLPVIQGFIIVIGIATTLTYLILDVLVMALDPRVSYSRTRNS